MGYMKRHVIVGLMTIGLSGGSYAADPHMYDPDPRIYAPADLVPAPPLYWNWSGYYLGGHWGFTSGTIDPGNATNSMVEHILRVTTIEVEGNVSEWMQLRKTSATGQTYGGFIGFNSQWDDVILGLELHYSFGKLKGVSKDSIGRSFIASDGYRYNVNLKARTNVTIDDYAALRGRAGYVLGRYLPYAQLGFVVGRGDVFRSATVQADGTDADPGNPPALPPVGLNITDTQRKTDAIIYGLSAGVGLDLALTPNIFLRGEYEYVMFFPFHGVKASLNTGRVGVAVKF
jgi:outer membrane immunogenic protein